MQRGEEAKASPTLWTPVSVEGQGWFFHRPQAGGIPISLVLTASGRLSSVTNFFASSRTSMTLLRRANTGARGKEATKRVTKPNWTTEREHRHEKLHEGEAGLRSILPCTL